MGGNRTPIIERSTTKDFRNRKVVRSPGVRLKHNNGGNKGLSLQRYTLGKTVGEMEDFCNRKVEDTFEAEQ